jgi:RNA-binding protein PNO1
MVVTHPPTEIKKKNRRRVSRKNPATSKSNPSSSSSHQDRDGEAMPDAEASASHSIPAEVEGTDEDQLMITVDASLLPQNPTAAPVFSPVAAGADKTTLKSQSRRIPIPPHRMTPLKKDWLNVFGPLTEILGLQVRMNVQRRCVEIRV